MKKFVAKDGEKTTEYVLKDGVNLVGRDDNCDVVIDSQHISRNHISVVVKRDGVVIQDLNSRNGTFVNGLRVKNSVEVKNGDVVSLGKYRMVFISEEESAEHPPATPVSVEHEEREAPAGEQDTLPLKSHLAGGFGDQASGMAGSRLPAKFDPKRYQVATQDRKIVVTDGVTGQAIELYRGTPDAALLDRLIAERRARQRRNTILGVLGGLGLLVAIVVVAIALSAPEKDTRSAGRVDERGYYETINRAVIAFRDEGNVEKARKLLDDAEKLAKGKRQFSMHQHIRSIIKLYKDAEDNLETFNADEALRILRNDIELDVIDPSYDTTTLKEWVNKQREVVADFRNNQDAWRTGQLLKEQQNLMNAIKVFGQILSDSPYYDRAQKEIEDLGIKLTTQILGKSPDELKDTEINPGLARDMLEHLDKVLQNRIVPDSKRQLVFDFRQRCKNLLDLEAKRMAVLQKAADLYDKEKYDEAWKVIEDEGLQDDPDELVQKLAGKIRLAKELRADFDKAQVLYNEGKAEDALAILRDRKVEHLEWHEKYLVLKNRIEGVVNLFKSAQEALAVDDVEKVKEQYEEITRIEDSPVNFYHRAANSWL
ncbi:MAG: FHA domain-containing protein, partial [Planctomycetota bacterium]